MKQHCPCGRAFTRTRLPDGNGWITGCPECTQTPAFQAALACIVAAAISELVISKPSPKADA